jgi:hypothetical protein
VRGHPPGGVRLQEDGRGAVQEAVAAPALPSGAQGAELALKRLGLEGGAGAPAFNVDLEACLDFRRRLAEAVRGGGAARTGRTGSRAFSSSYRRFNTPVFSVLQAG